VFSRNIKYLSLFNTINFGLISLANFYFDLTSPKYIDPVFEIVSLVFLGIISFAYSLGVVFHFTKFSKQAEVVMQFITLGNIFLQYEKDL